MTRVRSALTSLRRSPYQSLAAIVMSAITFFVVSLFTLIFFGTHQLLNYFESRPQVTAFFKDSTTETAIKELQNRLEQTGQTQAITYISKDAALASYKADNADNPLLLEMVTADILPASLEVSGRSVADLEPLAQILSADPGVEEVVYQKNEIQTLKKWITGLRLGGLSLSLLLLFSSFITIIVILGMRVALRKTEINTLSLLGASGWYIRAPLIYEALFYELVGVVLGWGGAYLALLYLTPNLLAFFADINLLPVPPLFMLATLGAELILGILLGFFASLSATRRYGR